MRWCVLYDDGVTFSHVDGEPRDAPAHGVIAVVQEAPAQVLHQADFYWWRDGLWWGGDVFGFIDQAALGATWVKQGRTVLPDAYREIMSRAVALNDEWGS